MHEYNDFRIGDDSVKAAGITSGVAVSGGVAHNHTLTHT